MSKPGRDVDQWIGRVAGVAGILVSIAKLVEVLTPYL